MRDTNPPCPAIPASCLVPPERQPEYLPLPGVELGGYVNAGVELADAHVAAGRGEQLAVIHHETGATLTYRELATESSRLAARLVRLGLRPGERVAYRMPNRPEAIITAIAVWKAGGVVVPTPAQARAGELEFFLTDTGARFLVLDGREAFAREVPEALRSTAVDHVVHLAAETGPPPPTPGSPTWHDWAGLDGTGPLPPVPADQVALIWHTGGTTGRPKGCYHTHRRFLLAGHAHVRAAGVAPGQRWCAAAPLGHALGFIHSTNFTLLAGATVVLVEDFTRPDTVLDAVARHHVDVLTAITATWARLLPVPSDTSSLRRGYAMWQSASAGGVVEGWRERGVELLNNFGSTAFATWVLQPDPADPGPPAALGRAAPGYEVVVVPGGSEGRMAVRGPSGLTYWNRPELQARDVVDGWTLVDDLIRFDAGGHAHHLGRTDFLVSTAGYKVAPVEVEAVLATHPAVREVCVVGAPDPVRQEVVAAYVAVRDGHTGDDALRTELQDLAKARLSPYKYPRRVEFVDALPRDHVGKVLPRTVQRWARGESPTPEGATR